MPGASFAAGDAHIRGFVENSQDVFVREPLHISAASSRFVSDNGGLVGPTSLNSTWRYFLLVFHDQMAFEVRFMHKFKMADLALQMPLADTIFFHDVLLHT